MNKKPDVEVASILRLVRLCQNMNTLPAPGGLLDQDSYFVYLFEQVLHADEEKAELDRARAKVEAQAGR